MTDEQGFVQGRLIELGVRLELSRLLASAAPRRITHACAYTGREAELACGTFITVTGRLPQDDLYHQLAASAGGPLRTLTRIGDCLAPGLIADAVYAGHKFARRFGAEGADAPPRRERPMFEGSNA